MEKVERQRCQWAGTDPLMLAYHDTEWGTPLHDDQRLFELMVLEMMQAGLSWFTVLRKRTNFANALDEFDPRAISKYNESVVARLMDDEGIIRNRAKLTATVSNAQVVLELQKELGSLDSYVWTFVNGTPIVNSWKDMSFLPAKSAVAEAMSKELKRRGMKFVGPTICYAFMQAAGLVNDHTTNCFRYAELTASA